MKNRIKTALFLFTFFTGFHASGQIRPQVREAELKINGSSMNGFIVSVPYVKPDEVKKDWIRLIEKGTKSKVELYENSEILLNGANLKDISDSSMNIYSKVVSNDTASFLQAAFEIKDFGFINSGEYSTEATLIRTMMFNFARDEYSDVVEDELKSEEKTLKDLEKELDKTIQEKDKMEKEIIKYESDIMVTKDKILNLEYDLKTQQQAINDQKTTVSKISKDNKDEKKTQEEVLKDLEKEKKRIFKDIENGQKDIVEYNSKIQENKLDIIGNLSDQETLREKISGQEKIVEQIAAELKTLKDMQL